MNSGKPLQFVFNLTLVTLLLAGCEGVSTGTAATSTPILPTTTLTPVPTSIPKETPEPTTVSSDFTSVTPLATAPFIHFAGWSPDSQWIAYWVSSQDDVNDQIPYTMPGGTLHFANVMTGESCAVSQFVTPSDRAAEVNWTDEGEAIVVTREGVFTGKPCQTESYTALAHYMPDKSRLPDPAVSPDGRYCADTTLLSTEEDIDTFETTITTSDDVQSLQRVAWQRDTGTGPYGLGGEWISRSQFLVYVNFAEGPLIIDVERGVISVLTDLLGLREPSILNKKVYAGAAPGVEPDTFHLLLPGFGREEMTLYHAESGLVETLPYRAAWWGGFSDDHEWLLMDERPDVDGYESHAIWIRRVEDINGEWQLLAKGVDSALWTADWTEMAFSNDDVVTWQTFPDAELIGHWHTGQFRIYPVAWSPDGRFLVTEGNVPGSWEYGLFVLER